MKLFLYKLLALLFLGTAIALGLMVLHFILASAEIIITANQVPVNIEKEIQIEIKQSQQQTSEQSIKLNSNIAENDKSKIEELRELILGKSETELNQEDKSQLIPEVKSILVKTTLKTEPKGKAGEIDGTASGLVTIYNEMSFNQTLVANTRLLSKEGILFRTKNSITAPAFGTVEAEVYADKKGKTGNLPPTTFTIPGLSAARQKLVYGKNEQPFAGGVMLVKKLEEADFVKAKEEAQNILLQKALEEFNKINIAVATSDLLLSQILFTSLDKIGDQKSVLVIDAKAEALALVFNKDALLAETKRYLAENLPSDQIILAYNKDSFSYKIISIDENVGIAVIKSYLEGFATLKENSNDIIDTRALVGLKTDEIQTLLLKNKAVQAVTVRFAPFWVNQTPRIAEKIKIKIVETKNE